MRSRGRPQPHHLPITLSHHILHEIRGFQIWGQLDPKQSLLLPLHLKRLVFRAKRWAISRTRPTAPEARITSPQTPPAALFLLHQGWAAPKAPRMISFYRHRATPLHHPGATEQSGPHPSALLAPLSLSHWVCGASCCHPTQVLGGSLQSPSLHSPCCMEENLFTQ